MVDINISDNNLICKENCYLNFKTNDNYIYIFVEHEYYPSHGHFYTEMLWRYYYYFKFIEKQNTILLLKNGGEFNFFLDYLNIQHQFIDNLVQSDSYKNGFYRCSKFYSIKNNTNYECDINDFQKDNFDKKIFFYRNKINNLNDNYKVNFRSEFNVGHKFLFMVDKILEKLNEEKPSNKYLKDKLYISRRNDRPQKFYHIDNIEEVSNAIVSNGFFEISPLSSIKIIEKLFYVNNCRCLIIEYSSALNYAYFAKPDTKIYIIVPSLKIHRDNPTVLSLIHRFKFVKLIYGYDNIPKIWDFTYFQKQAFNNLELTTFLGFYFPEEEKMKNIFNDEFKFYNTKRMILHPPLIENVVPIWNVDKTDSGFWGNYKKILDTKNYTKIKTNGRVYEYINSSLRNKIITDEEKNLLEKFPNVINIPGNTINRRFILTKDEFEYIINKCKEYDIEIYPIPYSVWHMNKTFIDLEELKNVLQT
jgi:hypothetical protein